MGRGGGINWICLGRGVLACEYQESWARGCPELCMQQDIYVCLYDVLSPFRLNESQCAPSREIGPESKPQQCNDTPLDPRDPARGSADGFWSSSHQMILMAASRSSATGNQKTSIDISKDINFLSIISFDSPMSHGHS